MNRPEASAGRRVAAVVATILLSASLGACSSGGSDSRSGKPCMSKRDEELFDNSRLTSQRLNEIIDCWTAQREK